MVKKDHANFLEDFARLRPGETFTAWRIGRGWEVETTLEGKELIDWLKEIKERSQELKYIISFAEASRF